MHEPPAMLSFVTLPWLYKHSDSLLVAGLLDPKQRALTCGQWVNINVIHSANPYTDFCNVVGNACNAQGRHYYFRCAGLKSSSTAPCTASRPRTICIRAQCVCSASAGQLTQFNMNGWNLAGTFPVDQLARFRALSEIDISNNPNMKADLKKMFDAFAQLQNLQVRLTGTRSAAKPVLL